jgi:hypothetical protein
MPLFISKEGKNKRSNTGALTPNQSEKLYGASYDILWITAVDGTTEKPRFG